MTDITPAVRADLAPTGKVRAGINYGNFILASKDPATGESRGVAIDLTRELAQRLGVPVEIVAYDSVAVMGDAAPTGAWDIAFLGSDPAREGLMGLAERLPGSRMLDGRFMAVQQSIGVPKGRDAGLAYLRRVVEDAKASGLVARAIEKTGARGVSVAPRAPVQ